MKLPDWADPEYTDYGAPAEVPDWASPEYTDYGPPAVREQTPLQALGNMAMGGTGSLARGAIKGVGVLPALFTDPITRIVNYYAGTNVTPMSESVDMVANAMGVPQMGGKGGETLEAVGGAAGSAMMGAGLAGKLAQWMKPASSPGEVTQSILKLAAEDPLKQGAAAGLGGYAAKYVQDQGGGPLEQNAAAILAGMTVPVAGTVGRAGRIAVGGTGGIDDAAALALHGLASSPDDALKALQTATPSRVPGYVRGTDVTARDLGLMGSIGPLRSRAPEVFAARESANNQAVLGYLRRAFGPSADDVARRVEAKIVPRIEQITQQAKPVDPSPILSKLDDMAANPRWGGEGPRAIIKTVRDQADQMFQEGGWERFSDPRWWYDAVRKDLAGKLANKYDAMANRRLGPNDIAATQEILKTLDDVIDTGLPGYRAYWMAPYAKGMKAVERRQLFDTIIGDTFERSGVADLQGAGMATPHRWVQTVNKLADDINARMERGGMTPRQRAAINTVTNEMRNVQMRGMTRPAGSDTYRNITMGALVGRLVGGGVGQDAPKWIKQTLSEMPGLAQMATARDEKVMARLAEALLDPEIAKHLLVRANQLNAASLDRALAKRVTASSVGAQIPGMMED